MENTGIDRKTRKLMGKNANEINFWGTVRFFKYRTL